MGCRKRHIAKTIRDAVETYDGFGNTLMGDLTLPGLKEKHEIHLSKIALLGYTAFVAYWGEFRVLRAFVRWPVLARRETEVLYNKCELISQKS